MNRQSVTKAQKPKEPTSLPSTDILQRKTINRTDFEASRVEARSLSGQHIDKPSLPSAASHFSYNFSKIPVTSNSPYPIQAKLKIGQTDDKYEQEADRVVKQVMRMPNEQIQRPIPAVMKSAPDTKQSRLHQLVQSKGIGISEAREPQVPSVVLQALRSSSQPLDANTRTFFEPRFRHDFSRVRVHTDARAAASAQAINALAYTVGHQVVFGAGRYTPQSVEGRRLLAHELTHVVQQHSAPRLIQRNAAIGTATAMPTEAANIDNQIVLVQQAIEQLREREAEDESGEMAAHLRNLITALSELQRIKASGTSEEQMQIANHFAALCQEAQGAAGPTPLLQRWATGMGASADPLEQEAQAFADEITQDVSHQRQPATVPRPVTAIRPRIQREAATATLVAGGIAAGPPGWVVLAVVAVGVAVVGGVYLATRPRTTERAEERAEPRVEPRVVPRTCATVYPAALRCESLPGSFSYLSPQAALGALKLSTGISSLRLVNPAPSTGGPCPGVGMHYGVKERGVYIASISCCPCCRDTPAGPVMTTMCRII
jgi:hypothetical protein